MAELLINEDTYRDHLGDGTYVEFGGHMRHLCATPRRTEFGCCRSAAAFSKADLIPRSEWDARIAKKDEDKSWLHDLISDKSRSYYVPVKDQNGTNYCHGYGPVHAAEVARARQGHAYVDLSAESVAGPVTGWWNRGHDPEDDFDWLCEHGACPASYMDRRWSRSPSRWQSGWETAALDFRVDEWWDLTISGAMFEACVTAALLDISCAVGFDWWHHEISGCYRVRKVSGKYQILHRNNWGDDWGDDGFGWFEEGRKAIPIYGIFGVRSITPRDLQQPKGVSC